MRAVINPLIQPNGIAATPLVRFRIDCYFEEGEAGYDEQLVPVPERLLTEEEEAQIAAAGTKTERQIIYEQIIATIPKVWVPSAIDCYFKNLAADIDEDGLKAAMRERIRTLKMSLSELPRVRQFIGLEVRE